MKSKLILLLTLALSAGAFAQSTSGSGYSGTGTGMSDSASDRATTAGADTSSKSDPSAKSSTAKKGESKLSEIAANPQKFANKNVTVTGEVQKLGADNKSFVLNDASAPSEQVVVITRSAPSMKQELKENAQVRVSGKVQQMSADEIQRKYSIELDSSLTDQMDSRMPVIVADSKSFKLIQSQ